MLNSKPINIDFEKEETILEKISYEIFHNPVSNFIRKQIRFVGRLCTWIPTIYADEDWDYNYLLDILQFKLLQMRKNIVADTIHDDVPRTVKKIDLLLERLNRYRNSENYLGEFPSSGEIEDMFEERAEGGFRMRESTPEQIEYIHKSYKFEQKNWDKFFIDLKNYLPYLWS